ASHVPGLSPADDRREDHIVAVVRRPDDARLWTAVRVDGTQHGESLRIQQFSQRVWQHAPTISPSHLAISARTVATTSSGRWYRSGHRGFSHPPDDALKIARPRCR